MGKFKTELLKIQIILNPFNQLYTNELLRFIAEEEKNIVGLIIINNEAMTSNQTYMQPKLISMMSPKTAENLKQYSV